MNKYRVCVEEILSRVVEIEAVTEDEALSKALCMWRDEDIVLDDTDFHQDKPNISILD